MLSPSFASPARTAWFAPCLPETDSEHPVWNAQIPIRGLMLVLTLLAFSLTPVRGQDKLMFVGTYTRGESQGIYSYRFNMETGAMRYLAVRDGVKNPSFLAVHPELDLLYSVCEVSEFAGEQGRGGVAAFQLDRSNGQLKLLNQQASGGAGPCHINVDATGQVVLVANYGGGSVAALPIAADGSLKPLTALQQHVGSSVNPRRQQGPHAHSINLDRHNRFAVAADLGLDQILIYRFDASQARLTPHQPAHVKIEPAGSGPRHFAFHPSGRWAFVINELASTITAFAYDESAGQLSAIQTVSTLPEGFTEGNSTAEVVVHPQGKFVYGSNRGHDSIAVFRLDEATGRLSQIQVQATGGQTPRNFAIAPGGRFLLAANQNTHDIHVFRIDLETGKLSPTEHSVRVPSPVCIRFR